MRNATELDWGGGGLKFRSQRRSQKPLFAAYLRQLMKQNVQEQSFQMYLILVQHEKAATFLDILKSFFRPTLVRV